MRETDSSPKNRPPMKKGPAAIFERNRPPKARSGFTIVELLVATAVFLMVALVVAAIVDSTAKLTSLSNRRMGADSSARQTFDRMSADFSRAVLRPELPDRIEKLPGNDKLTFYVRAQSYDEAADRGISKVAYLVDEDFVLIRGVEGFAWEAGTIPQLPFAGLTWPTDPANLHIGSFIEDRPSDDDPHPRENPTIDETDEEMFEVLSPGVFRFEYCFLLKDGTLSTVPVRDTPGSNLTASASPTNANLLAAGARWYRPTSGDNSSRTFISLGGSADRARWKRLGWEDVRAVVVGVATLDPEVRRSFNLTSEEMESLAATFADVGEGEDVLDAWVGWRADLDASDLPLPVINSVRVHQRYFLLNQ